MSLIDLVNELNIEVHTQERWVVLGPEAHQFARLLHPAEISFEVGPNLDGLLLAGILSTKSDASVWLRDLIASLREGSRLVAVDWQADGPPAPGPDIEQRFRRGKLCRLLREAGLATLDILASQPLYYIVQASKTRPPPDPHRGHFVEVAYLDELPKNGMKPVELFGRKIIVANTGREIVAFAQTCPHAKGEFDKGRLRGANVVCPVHYYIWNVRSGEPVEPADEDVLPRYPVRVDRDLNKVFVAVAD